LNKIDENWDIFEHKTKIRTYLKKFDENWDQKSILTNNKIKYVTFLLLCIEKLNVLYLLSSGPLSSMAFFHLYKINKLFNLFYMG